MVENRHHLSLRKLWLAMGLIFLSSLVLGVGFQLILNVGEFVKGFIAATFLFFSVGVGMFLVWRAAGSDKVVGWMMLTAFVIRIALGVFLAWGLPQFGYDTEVQQAGFVYADPFNRESNAWALAQSREPLTLAFRESFEGDQYGGLFALSAFIYRYLSPDAFRPVLMVILTAGASALSLPFFVMALLRLFKRRSALFAGWILALYPESILLGASQMREPFFILFFSLLLWAGTKIISPKKNKLSIFVFVLSTACLLLFSPRVAIPIISVVTLIMWVIKSPELKNSRLKIGGWIVLISGMLVLAWFVFEWIHDALQWDSYATFLKSGMVQFQLNQFPDWLSLPLIVLYGVFQPVLPAAIIAPAPWIWHSLGVFRAVGWYALLPLLIYVTIRLWHLASSKKKRILLISILVVWVWIFIASARAGGDQWDNPRYRTIFLPLMATLGAWGVVYARQTKDRWLWRGLLIEGVFVGMVTLWYLGRYFHLLPVLSLKVLVMVVLALGVAIVVGGILYDRNCPS